jgi:hypothetical protein
LVPTAAIAIAVTVRAIVGRAWIWVGLGYGSVLLWIFMVGSGKTSNAGEIRRVRAGWAATVLSNMGGRRIRCGGGN